MIRLSYKPAILVSLGFVCFIIVWIYWPVALLKVQSLPGVASNKSVSPSPKAHTVKYQVVPCFTNYASSDCVPFGDTIVHPDGSREDYKTGTCWASLTYENKDGGTEQINRAELCWSKTFTAYEGAFLYISAQNASSVGGIEVRIYVDGVLVKSSISKGGYTIATATAKL